MNISKECNEYDIDIDKISISFLSVEEFQKFSLHEKNSYLQKLADEFASMTDRKTVELDKPTLSRLRRYYSRRVWADLKLSEKPKDKLEEVLARLGTAIHQNTIQTDVKAALLQESRPKRILRSPPPDDAQLMFFVPSIYDAPIKDDVNLMDVAPFSLSKKVRKGVIQYELKDSLISIEGGAETGLATVFDYDIFLNMVSYLAEEVRQYRIAEGKGLRPDLPPKIYRPHTAQILKFCRRSTGGRQYDEIEQALKRLRSTSITVTNLSNGKRRQVDSRPLIGEFRVVSHTSSGKVDTIEITIPDWVWTSVVRSDKNLPLLTLNPDYFLISSGIGRFIYRLARKAAGKTLAKYTINELYKRSGSAQDLRFFARDLKKFVARTQAFPMPDYDLSFEEGKEQLILVMNRRTDETNAAEQLSLLISDEMDSIQYQKDI